MAAFSSIALTVFVVQRFVEYYFQKQQRLPTSPHSTISALGYGGSLVSGGLALLLTIEMFSSEQGLVASAIKPIADFQRSLKESIDRGKHSTEQTVIAKSAADLEGIEATTGTGAVAVADSFDDSPSVETNVPAQERLVSRSSADLLKSNGVPVEMVSPKRRVSSPKQISTQNDDPAFAVIEASSASSREQMKSSEASAAATNTKDGRAASQRISSKKVDPALVLIETKIGLQHERLFDSLVVDQACSPGGAFSEKLVVPVGTIIWGGDRIAPSPGGSY